MGRHRSGLPQHVAGNPHAPLRPRPHDAGEEFVCAYNIDLCPSRQFVTVNFLDYLPGRLTGECVPRNDGLRIERGDRCGDVERCAERYCDSSHPDRWLFQHAAGSNIKRDHLPMLASARHWCEGQSEIVASSSLDPHRL